MKALVPALAAGLLVLTGAAVSTAVEPDFGAMKIQPYQPPKPAPAFSLPDSRGKTWSLGEARGKVVLLFFWATW